jgi:hypothetical protein
MASDRATAGDILGLLSEPLHPVRPPQYDWWLRAWMWLPPWWEGDPETSVRDSAPLAEGFDSAEASLAHMRLQVVCEHGTPTGVPCGDCRTRIAEILHAIA